MTIDSDDLRNQARKFAEIQTVRIICNSILKERMLKSIQDLGATGYTFWECHGKGSKEIMRDPYTGDSRVYIEVWCNIEVADKIVEFCDSGEFRTHGISAGKETLKVHGRQAYKYSKKEA